MQNLWLIHISLLVCDLNRTPIVMAKHGGPCVHFSGISICGRTSRETVSHPQHPPLPTLCIISLSVYVIVANERLQPLTTTWYNSLVLSFSLLKIELRLIKHHTFLHALHSWRTGAPQLCRRGWRLFHVISEAIRDVKQTRRGCRSSSSNTLSPLIHDKARIEVYAMKCHTHAWKLN